MVSTTNLSSYRYPSASTARPSPHPPPIFYLTYPPVSYFTIPPSLTHRYSPWFSYGQTSPYPPKSYLRLTYPRMSYLRLAYPIPKLTYILVSYPRLRSTSFMAPPSSRFSQFFLPYPPGLEPMMSRSEVNVLNHYTTRLAVENTDLFFGIESFFAPG